MTQSIFLKLYLFLGITWMLSSSCLAQALDSLPMVNPKRMNALIGFSSVAYGGSMIGLGTIWYDNLSSFRFFNDNDGWGYMDKLGHVTSAQHIGRAGIAALRWTGLEEKKAVWIGGSTGLVYLTSVEVFDGFSPDWGFSWGDFASNTIGSALLIFQELQWSEQRILTKWSYGGSTYAQYRPELLGANGTERWLKDYNGQTYWLSFDIRSSLLKNSNFPAWLNFAVGYGIEGYTGANRNPETNDKGEAIPDFKRYAQVYFAPDINFEKIPTDSRFLQTLLGILNFLKAPLPAVEYNEVDGMKFHWIFF